MKPSDTATPQQIAHAQAIRARDANKPLLTQSEHVMNWRQFALICVVAISCVSLGIFSGMRANAENAKPTSEANSGSLQLVTGMVKSNTTLTGKSTRGTRSVVVYFANEDANRAAQFVKGAKVVLMTEGRAVGEGR